jgi:predicted Fe-Mo cluster-binding NifX family protein
MYKVAFAAWSGRVAPVFDVARHVRLVEVESGNVLSETEETLPTGPVHAKGRRLAELGVKALVCGAVSRPVFSLIAAYDIRVIPFVAGDLEEVIQAYLHGKLETDVFAMPGFCGRRGRRRRRGEP